jgi:hypothetical protein
MDPGIFETLIEGRKEGRKEKRGGTSRNNFLHCLSMCDTPLERPLGALARQTVHCHSFRKTLLSHHQSSSLSSSSSGSRSRMQLGPPTGISWDPLALPEILSRIGDFLPHSSLTVCLRVSRLCQASTMRIKVHTHLCSHQSKSTHPSSVESP